jgi:polar amino acid transport system permease protein
MLKYTSLAFAVAYNDLLSEAGKIYNANFKVIEVLLSATIWYLILCTTCSLIQGYIERRLASDLSPAARARMRLESEALG